MGLAKQVAKGAPRVTDKMVAFTAVTSNGIRHPVFGYEGKTLASALRDNPEIGHLCELMSPHHGPDAHVKIPCDFIAKLPELTADERDTLKNLGAWGSISPVNSRLASQVTLSKDLNEMVVAIDELHPHNMH